MSSSQTLSMAQPHVTGDRAMRALDWCERICILAFFCWLVARIVASQIHAPNAINLILLASEGLVVVFVLLRRTATQISLQPKDWLLAVAATILPLLVMPSPNAAWLPLRFAALLMLCGLIFQIATKIALGRRFGCVAAHRGLMLRGPYRFVRHPIYAGYLLGHVAYLLMNLSPWNVGIYGFAYLAQVPRLLAEERLLSRDPRYQQYMSTVRYRLLPGIF